LRASAAWEHRDADVATRINAAEADAMVAMAGMVAQGYYLRKTGVKKPDLGENGSVDMRNAEMAIGLAAMLAAGMPIPEGPFEPPDAVRADATARLERLWRATHKLLFDRWPAVKRLSKTLVHRDRIDQAELDRLIAGC